MLQVLPHVPLMPSLLVAASSVFNAQVSYGVAVGGSAFPEAVVEEDSFPQNRHTHQQLPGVSSCFS